MSSTPVVFGRRTERNEPAQRHERHEPTVRELEGISAAGPDRLALQPGEHYRFTFDMGACIGCHSCEVACAEQNGLPADVSWRRVGEIEGGSFPDTKRMHISMACNHCLEPACLQGCPTGAYTKLDNGIVVHHADDCIGCQYCTWNCPYSVPAFQPDRRIVTKCDMCSRRLEVGLESACVAACPTKAIGIEVIDAAAWRANPHDADAPHLPSSLITRSTTRIIVPDDMPADTESGTSHLLRLEHAHWSLLTVTLLTQMALGLALGTALGVGDRSSNASALLAAIAGALALGASPLHLGRPAIAYKALRNLRTSWLSREVLGFGLFGALAVLSAGAVVIDAPGATTVGWLTVAAGGAGVFASGRLYKVPGRPSWNSWFTVIGFFLSAVILGAPMLAVVLHPVPADERRALVIATVAALVAQLTLVMVNLWRWHRGSSSEARASVTLMLHHRRALFAARITTAGLAVAAGSMALDHASLVLLLLVVVAAGASEVLGRHLFYVTVVPLAMPGRFNGGWR